MVSVCEAWASAAEETRSAAAVSVWIKEYLRIGRSLVHVHGHHHRLSGAEDHALRDGVERDPDRDALGNLHEVAGGVIGREEREARTGAPGQAVHLAVDRPSVGVDVHVRRLTRAHLA